jgi:3-hydroxyisobutyrate dehydrogenase-like beta-hydroxyacid dehydrogenase
MRLVYEIRNQISDWQQQQAEAEEAAAEAAANGKRLDAPVTGTQEKKK